MKKIVLGIIAACILLITSCAKDNTTPAPITVFNGWSFKGNTYYTFISKLANDTLVSVDDTLGNYHSLLFIFPNVPTANGSYQVVNHSATPTGNQVKISYLTYGFPSVFNSLGGDTSNAVVTITNGKVSVSVNNIRLLSSTTAIDTSLLTATVSQSQ